MMPEITYAEGKALAHRRNTVGKKCIFVYQDQQEIRPDVVL